MVDIKDLFADKRYPAWIKSHSIFKNHKKVDKIFPHIGLNNCEEDAVVDNAKEAQASAKYLIRSLQEVISTRQQKLTNFAKKKTETAEKKQMNAKRKSKYEHCQFLLSSLKDTLAKQDAVITTTNGKITLKVPSDVKDNEGKVIFKGGEGLFRVYNKISESLIGGKFLPLNKMDSLPAFKDFSSKNVPANKFKIIFSSDGANGIWDIATMSMRGISSCQSWGNGDGNSTHIIGSIVDPFTGIIYLTSGAKHGSYGSKMLRRCVVRFIINDKTKKQSIYLERMYPALDQGTKDTFIEFIKKKTGGKYTVVYGPDSYATSNYVPLSKIVKDLNPSDHPYRDSGMVYKTDPNDTRSLIRDKAETIFARVNAAVGTKVLSSARIIKMATVPEASKESFRNFRGSSYYNDQSYQIYEDVVDMGKRFFSNQDYKQNDVLNLVKPALEDFSKDLPKRIFNTIKTSCTKRAIGKIDDSVLERVAEHSSKKIHVFINDELKKLTMPKPAAKNGSTTNELPTEIPVYIKLLSD